MNKSKLFNESMVVSALILNILFASVCFALPPETYYQGIDAGVDGDDHAVTGLPIGFTFNFYGNDYTTFGVDSNGYIMFDNDHNEYANRDIPNVLTPNNFIAAYWDDLYCYSGYDEYAYYRTIGSAPDRQLIVQWTNVHLIGHHTDADEYSPVLGTIQVILYETTNKIKIQYRYFGSKEEGWHGDWATIGIENADGTAGVEYSYDTCALLSEDVIVFTPSGSVYNVTRSPVETYEPVILGGGATASPAPLVLTSPPDREAASLTPTFSWNASANADTYDLIVSDDSTDYTSAVINATGLTTTTYTPSTPLTEGTTYYWSVIARNSDDQTWSNQWSFTATEASMPEIDLKQYTISIPHPGRYDFGSSAVGATIDTFFTIENNGGADLILTDSLSIDGRDADQFSIQTWPASTIASGGDTSFTVRFNPTSGGLKIATIYIPNNDGDESYYRLIVTGAVSAPEINLKHESDDVYDGQTQYLGSTKVGAHTDTIYTIVNTGITDLTLTTPLTVTGANADQFSIEVDPTSPVAPGNAATFTVRFTPTSAGLKTAAISIASNDYDENPYDFTLKAGGSETLPIHLAADFGVSGGNGGVHAYNVANGWFQIAVSDPYFILPADLESDTIDELYGGFASGFSVFNFGIWTLLTPSVAENIIPFNNGVAIDFGSTGLWTYDGAVWNRLTTSDAIKIVAVDINGGADELAAIFAGSSGVFLYDGSAWTRLTTTATEDIVECSGKLVVDFGSSGLYVWDNASWTRITTNNADLMISGYLYDIGGGWYDKLIAHLPSGVFIYNGDQWTNNLTTAAPDNMIIWRYYLYADFGAAGLHRYLAYAGNWSQTTTADPVCLAVVDADEDGNSELAAGFASGLFLWDYNWSSALTTSTPEAIVDMDQ